MIDRLCSLDARSYVDTLSNISFIDGVTPWSAMQGLEQGALANKVLSVLLHELTHHWASHSGVGQALMVAKMSAAWAMLGGGASAPPGVSPGDYAKYLAAGIFLRAWSEGLAQYAEFDVTSGQAHSTTFVMNSMWWLYCASKEAAADPARALNQRLRAMRTTRATIERKANALRQPFASSNGGYLPGLLAVKRLASRLRLAGGPFEDSDFVLGYLKLFVFDDPAVLAMFLDLDGMVFVREYFEHLRRRFTLLAECEDEELRKAGNELDQFLAMRPLDTLVGRNFPGLFFQPVDSEQALLRVAKRLEELGLTNEPSRLATSGPENVLQRFYQAVVLQRRFLCLASCELPLSEVRTARLTTGEPVVLVRTPERNTYVLAHWHQDRYVDLDKIEELRIDPESPAHITNVSDLFLEVWMNVDEHYAFVCLHSPKRSKVGIRRVFGRPPSLNDVPWSLMPRDGAVGLVDLIDQQLAESRIKAADGSVMTLAEATAALHDRILNDSDALLAEVAFPSHASVIGPKLAKKGLGSLPSYRPDALRGLALVTLADTTGQPAEQFCSQAGLPSSCLEMANKLVEDMQELSWAPRNGSMWVV